MGGIRWSLTAGRAQEHVCSESVASDSDALRDYFGPFCWRTLTVKDKDNYRLSAANLKPARWSDVIVFSGVVALRRRANERFRA